jgi:hypothetical protein
MALYEMLLMRANPLIGQVGWALEISTFGAPLTAIIRTVVTRQRLDSPRLTTIVSFLSWLSVIIQQAICFDLFQFYSCQCHS